MKKGGPNEFIERKTDTKQGQPISSGNSRPQERERESDHGFPASGTTHSPMAYHHDAAQFGWEAWEHGVAPPQATALSATS